MYFNFKACTRLLGDSYKFKIEKGIRQEDTMALGRKLFTTTEFVFKITPTVGVTVSGKRLNHLQF